MSDLRDVCRSYKGESHQDEALLWLQEHLQQGAWEIFLKDWRKVFLQPAKGIVLMRFPLVGATDVT